MKGLTCWNLVTSLRKPDVVSFWKVKVKASLRRSGVDDDKNNFKESPSISEKTITSLSEQIDPLGRSFY